MARTMNLGQLITQLQRLSKNGKNDNMSVEVYDDNCDFVGNISCAYIDTCQTPNDEYDFIKLVIN